MTFRFTHRASCSGTRLKTLTYFLIALSELLITLGIQGTQFGTKTALVMD